MIEKLKSSLFLGNTQYDYLVSAGYAVAGLFLIWVIKSIVISKFKDLAKKTSNTFDDGLILLIEKHLVPPLYFGVIYFVITDLNLPKSADKFLSSIVTLFVTFFGIRFILGFINFLIFDFWIPQKEDKQNLEVQFKSLMPLATATIWCLGFIFLLSNLGFNISALVTGLGIGGVAVALAASAVLGDLFAYVSIMFDKPFIIGDFLIVGDFLGSVEHIGIKTTRLRSLGGEQLIFSNKDLTDSRIRNYKRMDKRRVVFKLGVTYDTSSENLKESVKIIRSIIEKAPDAIIDRCHFSSYGDFSLNIETVYYVLSSDYNKYMDIQQNINFSIKEEFEKRGIEFAFPTQTLYTVNTPKK